MKGTKLIGSESVQKIRSTRDKKLDNKREKKHQNQKKTKRKENLDFRSLQSRNKKIFLNISREKFLKLLLHLLFNVEKYDETDSILPS